MNFTVPVPEDEKINITVNLLFNDPKMFTIVKEMYPLINKFDKFINYKIKFI